MALIECPDCKSQVSDSAKACVKCGKSMESIRAEAAAAAKKAAREEALRKWEKAPRWQKWMVNISLIAVALVVALAIVGSRAKKKRAGGDEPKAETPGAAERVAAITPGQDRERRELIRKLEKAGLFVRIAYESKTSLQIWVGKPWGTLTFTERADFVNVVMTEHARKWGYDRDLLVTVKDANGKQVGFVQRDIIDL